MLVMKIRIIQYLRANNPIDGVLKDNCIAVRNWEVYFLKKIRLCRDFSISNTIKIYLDYQILTGYQENILFVKW